jgi:hypothetical protein
VSSCRSLPVDVHAAVAAGAVEKAGVEHTLLVADGGSVQQLPRQCAVHPEVIERLRIALAAGVAWLW